jgi:hypothetical protein
MVARTVYLNVITVDIQLVKIYNTHNMVRKILYTEYDTLAEMPGVSRAGLRHPWPASYPHSSSHSLAHGPLYTASERTQKKTPPYCCLRVAAREQPAR